MSSLEVEDFRPISVPGDVPEGDLVRMFPNTYFVYRVLVASIKHSDPEERSILEAKGFITNEGEYDSFNAF